MEQACCGFFYTVANTDAMFNAFNDEYRSRKGHLSLFSFMSILDSAYSIMMTISVRKATMENGHSQLVFLVVILGQHLE